MKVILSGGGTLGSVSPLLAISQKIKKQKPEAEFLWLGIKNGPEKKLIDSYQIPFKAIFSGKLRRYLDLRNLLAPFSVILGFIQSFFLILKFKPDIILSAGGFVSVPVIWSGWFLQVPALIHQQDIKPGLANKLMVKVAKKITVTFPESLKNFPSFKTILTGNPARTEIIGVDKNQALSFFNLDSNLPVILVLGGGTGALSINNLILEALPKLVEFCQIIHLTGIDKIKTKISHIRYQAFDFLTKDLKYAYASADLVISRAGLSVLTELSVLGKPTIIVPLPNSHQETNAIIFFKNNAAILLPQYNLTSEILVAKIKEILNNPALLENLSRNISKMMPIDATERIVSEIFKIMKEKI